MKKINNLFLFSLVFLLLSGCATSSNFSTKPVTLTGITSTKAIACGLLHSCALLSDGRVKCWGSGKDGQLGNGTTIKSSAPVLVEGISTAIAITAGGGHTCALLEDGHINCWGFGRNGQLGNGLSENFSTPVKVKIISDAKAIAAGFSHSCALLKDGTGLCWGNGSEGQLGKWKNYSGSLIPEEVHFGKGKFKSIGTGVAHSCAVLKTGSIKCWGSDSYPQPPEITFSLRSGIPTIIPDISTATEVVAGRNHTCSLLSNGTVKCWGSNYLAQIGTGLPNRSYPEPLPVNNLSQVKKISAGAFHTCALLRSGKIKCWGDNHAGQLGNVSLTDEISIEPVDVPSVSNVIDLSSRGAHTCVVISDGSVKCWGANDARQLGRALNGNR